MPKYADDLALHWLKEVFDPNTRRRTVGTHRLLILDGHGSHVTPEFDKYCTENCIVALQMPPHSSHLLQPLDVGCFSPLKTTYGRKVQEKMLGGINNIDKQDFLVLYLEARRQALSPSNIRSGFIATGLSPFDPTRVLCRLQVQVDKVGNNHHIDHSGKHTPSPHQSQEAYMTPYNVNQLTTHAERLLQRRPQNAGSPASQAINQLIKGCQMAMHSAVLLADENRQLRSENQRRKRKREQRLEYISDGGALSVAEGTARVKRRREDEEERAKRRKEEEEERVKRRREKRNGLGDGRKRRSGLSDGGKKTRNGSSYGEKWKKSGLSDGQERKMSRQNDGEKKGNGSNGR